MMKKLNQSDQAFSSEIQLKVEAELVASVYKQSNLGAIASVICATVLLVGLYPVTNHALILSWYGTFLMILFMRFILVKKYMQLSAAEKNLEFWRRTFIGGACAAGACWGFISGVLFPYPHLMPLVLDILILAGMTAGAVPLLSGIVEAAVGFLLLAILPLNIRLVIIDNATFLLFDIALFVYLIYMIILSFKTYKMTKHTIGLQFENELLLKHLSEAKLQLETINKKLEYTATHDPLTNLMNRFLFEKKLTHEIQHAAKSQQSLAILYIDVDYLKEINETYGRHIGDLLLQKIAARITHELPENVLAARFGGDEIMAVLQNITNTDEVEMVAQQICKAISVPFEIEDCNIMATVSIGIGLFPVDGRDSEILLRNVDKAMMAAKESGGNSFCFNSDPATMKTALSSAFPKSKD